MMMNSQNLRCFEEDRGLDRVADEEWLNVGAKVKAGFIGGTVIAVIALLVIF